MVGACQSHGCISQSAGPQLAFRASECRTWRRKMWFRLADGNQLQKTWTNGNWLVGTSVTPAKNRKGFYSASRGTAGQDPLLVPFICVVFHAGLYPALIQYLVEHYSPRCPRVLLPIPRPALTTVRIVCRRRRSGRRRMPMHRPPFELDARTTLLPWKRQVRPPRLSRDKVVYLRVFVDL